MKRELPIPTGRQSVDEQALPPTRADWVEKQLRRDILYGVYAPGTRLLAGELANSYDVSLTPMREALQHLATDGLITLTPPRGMRAPPPSLPAAKQSSQ